MQGKEMTGLKPHLKKKICRMGPIISQRRGPKTEMQKISNLRARTLKMAEQACRVTLQLHIPSLHVVAKQEKILQNNVQGKALSWPGRALVRERHWLHG